MILRSESPGKPSPTHQGPSPSLSLTSPALGSLNLTKPSFTPAYLPLAPYLIPGPSTQSCPESSLYLPTACHTQVLTSPTAHAPVLPPLSPSMETTLETSGYSHDGENLVILSLERVEAGAVIVDYYELKASLGYIVSLTWTA